MAVGIFLKIKQLVQKVGKGLQWANDNVYKPFIKPFAKPILGALGPVGQTIGKGLDVASSFLDYGYGADKNSQFRQDFETQKFMILARIIGIGYEWLLAAPSASSASSQKLLQKAMADWPTGQQLRKNKKQ
ncbi:MAG: hypothetical protein EZS28_036441, partial [Streblomastix strix]